MSGNATNHPTRRVSQVEHDETVAEVRAFLDAKGIPNIPTTSLSGKESHGDIDIVVSEDHWLIAQGPATLIKGNEVRPPMEFPEGVLGQASRTGFTHVAWPIKNANDGGHVQVDFIRTPAKHLEQTKTYLSHGTLGNIIGLICRSIGIRYKMTGLELIARHPDGQKCGGVEIASDATECLRLIQMPEDDIQRMLHGSFPTREDYYPLITRLPFFHIESVNVDKMTAPNRGRDKKRPEIMPCREWLLANNMGNQDWELPDRENTEAYLGHHREWAIRLLGKERYDGLIEQANELSQKLRAQVGPKSDRREWFEKFSKIVKIPDGETGMTINRMAKASGKTVDEYTKANTPEEAATQYKALAGAAMEI